SQKPNDPRPGSSITTAKHAAHTAGGMRRTLSAKLICKCAPEVERRRTLSNAREHVYHANRRPKSRSRGGERRGLAVLQRHDLLVEVGLRGQLAQPGQGLVQRLVAEREGSVSNRDHELGAQILEGVEGVERRHVRLAQVQRLVAGDGEKRHLRVK